jgi:hypothetical protein
MAFLIMLLGISVPVMEIPSGIILFSLLFFIIVLRNPVRVME